MKIGRHGRARGWLLRGFALKAKLEANRFSGSLAGVFGGMGRKASTARYLRHASHRQIGLESFIRAVSISDDYLKSIVNYFVNSIPDITRKRLDFPGSR